MSSVQSNIDEFYIHVGEKLRFQRKKSRMDQETLSRHLNLSRTTVINIEKGRQRLSLQHAWLAAKILCIPIEILLPQPEIKTVDEWETEVQKSGVTSKDKQGLLNWISKVKGQ